MKSRVSAADVFEFEYPYETGTYGRPNPCPVCGGWGCFKVTPPSEQYPYEHYTCFKENEDCGHWNGDIFDLLKKVKGMSFDEAYKLLDSDDIPKYDVEETIGKAESKRHEIKEPMNDEVDKCSQRNEKYDYFATVRGISKEVVDQYKLGYDSFSVMKRGNYYTEGLNVYRHIIPIFYHGELNSVICRLDDEAYTAAKKKFETENKDREFHMPKVHNIRFGADMRYLNEEVIESKDADRIFLCEGAMDALSLIDMGYDAISVNGANNIKRLREVILKNHHDNRSYVIAFDGDETGLEARAELEEFFSCNGIDSVPLKLPSGHKDINEFFAADREALKHCLKALPEKEENYPAHSFLSLVKVDYLTPKLKLFSASSLFPVMTEKMGAFESGKTTILAAESYVGKSTYAVNIMDALAYNGHHVLYLTFEESASDIKARLASKILSEHYGKAITPKDVRLERNEEWTRVLFKKVSDRNGYLYMKEMKFRATIKDIEDEIRSFKSIHKKVPFVIIDSLQRVAGLNDNMMEKQKLDENTEGIRKIAGKYNTHIMTISLVNREAYGKFPDSGALKGSGDIEYQSDNIFFLCYKAVIDQGKKLTPKQLAQEKGNTVKELTLYATKNRQAGMEGVVTELLFYGDRSKFEEVGGEAAKFNTDSMEIKSVDDLVGNLYE